MTKINIVSLPLGPGKLTSLISTDFRTDFRRQMALLLASPLT
jgi:hypothetical protein